MLVAAIVSCAVGIVFGYVLGWSSRGSHEADRRGGDILDPHRRP